MSGKNYIKSHYFDPGDRVYVIVTSGKSMGLLGPFRVMCPVYGGPRLRGFDLSHDDSRNLLAHRAMPVYSLLPVDWVKE